MALTFLDAVKLFFRGSRVCKGLPCNQGESTTLNLANYIIKQSMDLGVSVTPLSLQSILYIVVTLYEMAHNRYVIDETFELRGYGPYCNRLWNCFNAHPPHERIEDPYRYLTNTDIKNLTFVDVGAALHGVQQNKRLASLVESVLIFLRDKSLFEIHDLAKDLWVMNSTRYHK